VARARTRGRAWEARFSEVTVNGWLHLREDRAE
jgi:hypothetical protein